MIMEEAKVTLDFKDFMILKEKIDRIENSEVDRDSKFLSKVEELFSIMIADKAIPDYFLNRTIKLEGNETVWIGYANRKVTIEFGKAN